jgi:hypothetical protein
MAYFLVVSDSVLAIKLKSKRLAGGRGALQSDASVAQFARVRRVSRMAAVRSKSFKALLGGALVCFALSSTIPLGSAWAKSKTSSSMATAAALATSGGTSVTWRWSQTIGSGTASSAASMSASSAQASASASASASSAASPLDAYCSDLGALLGLC